MARFAHVSFATPSFWSIRAALLSFVIGGWSRLVGGMNVEAGYVTQRLLLILGDIATTLQYLLLVPLVARLR